jgi:hypothetical protein
MPESAVRDEVKQLALIAALPTHHDPPPSPNESSERESWHADNHELFFNIIDPEQTSDVWPRLRFGRP